MSQVLGPMSSWESLTADDLHTSVTMSTQRVQFLLVLILHPAHKVFCLCTRFTRGKAMSMNFVTENSNDNLGRELPKLTSQCKFARKRQRF